MARLTPERSRGLWRRQVVLTALLALSFAALALLSGRVHAASHDAVARRRLSLPPADHTWLVAALVVAGVALVVLLGAVCVHAFRIAQLTFRRGDDY